MNIKNKELFDLCKLEDGEIILNKKNKIIEEIGLSRASFIFICYDELIIEMNKINRIIFQLCKKIIK